MKKLILLLAVVFSLKSVAQSFNRAAVVLDFNSGIEAFSTAQKYMRIPGKDTSIANQAANKHASFGLEIGLSKRFGVGLRGKYNSFFTDLDAVTRYKSAITSTDLLITLNLHPIVRDNLDLIIGADLGVSRFTSQMEDPFASTFKSNGTYFAPYLESRFYFGRVGFNIRAAIPRVKYKYFKNDFSEDRENAYNLSYWQGAGFGISCGVQLKLF